MRSRTLHLTDRPAGRPKTIKRSPAPRPNPSSCPRTATGSARRQAHGRRRCRHGNQHNPRDRAPSNLRPPDNVSSKCVVNHIERGPRSEFDPQAFRRLPSPGRRCRCAALSARGRQRRPLGGWVKPLQVKRARREESHGGVGVGVGVGVPNGGAPGGAGPAASRGTDERASERAMATADERSQQRPAQDEGGGGPRDQDPLSLARALTGLVLCALIVSTLLGNTLVCAAVVKFRHLRSKVTNSFVISLAVSDLFVAVLVMPWRAVSEVAGAWLFGRFCDTWVAFDIMCSTASILNLCIISMDRYWAISNPFRYERKMTRRFALVMIGVAWTLSILISFIPVQLNWHRDAASAAVRAAAADDDDDGRDDCNASLNRTYAIASSLISFYIPVLIMVGTYTRIFHIAQTQIRRISSLERAPAPPQDESALKSSFKRETKVLKTLSVIMGVFVFCWLPFFVLNCAVPFCQAADCVSDTTFSIFVWFGWANSSLNPVIYAFNADFRKAFSTILGCNRLCSGSPVEAVDFSNQLVSYHHDTTAPKEAAAVPPPAGPRRHRFDQVSVLSDDSRSRADPPPPPAVPQSEADISLDMTPFGDSYTLPGQVRDQ
ncbi:D(1)-like dopamine receptor [Syngnathoides biaculeatus]|uniref:D(1)-like dopamine receptor n=1 Tax=Syngnathoides biaculeatus TaxID=300417 RepID=UPI002ADE4DA4|nr:D(1)-like dopamine receptor [Syngnathoides biaculeatus]